MTINILTLFPNYFKSILNSSILKRAQEKIIVKFNIVNIRNFTTDKHATVDDRPFGGGPGMLMKIEPIFKALESLKPDNNSKIILTSAKGKLFTQQKAINYSKLKELTIICGHYEGVDERVTNLVDEKIRVGNYVLTGGEPAANILVDSVVRLIDGVLGNKQSNQDESHSEIGKMSYPQYTRPKKFNDWKVPDILLTGNHRKISEWRKKNSGFVVY